MYSIPYPASRHALAMSLISPKHSITMGPLWHFAISVSLISFIYLFIYGVVRHVFHKPETESVLDISVNIWHQENNQLEDGRDWCRLSCGVILVLYGSSNGSEIVWKAQRHRGLRRLFGTSGFVWLYWLTKSCLTLFPYQAILNKKRLRRLKRIFF